MSRHKLEHSPVKPLNRQLHSHSLSDTQTFIHIWIRSKNTVTNNTGAFWLLLLISISQSDIQTHFGLDSLVFSFRVSQFEHCLFARMVVSIDFRWQKQMVTTRHCTSFTLILTTPIENRSVLTLAATANCTKFEINRDKFVKKFI